MVQGFGEVLLLAVVVFFNVESDLVDVVGGVGGLNFSLTKYCDVIFFEFHNRMRGLFPENVVELPLAHHAG